MKSKYLKWICLLGISALLASCTHPGERSTTSAGNSFSEMQEMVSELSAYAKSGLALVKLEGVKRAGNSYTLSGGSLARNTGTTNVRYCGLILDAEGHILIPRHTDPESSARITVWIGDTEYNGKIIKSDDRLDLAIIKINPDEPLTALPRSKEKSMSAGAWGIMLEPGDEQKDFEIFTSLSFCRGEVAGYYSELLMDGTPSMQGSPLLDLDGQVVGILRSRGYVRSMVDLEEDLAVLIAEAMGTDEDDETKEGWLGILVKPVNKAYGREQQIPRSALWVMYVFKGSPAADAGLQTGDVITGLHGKPLRFEGERARQFFMQSLRPKPDKAFTMDAIRDGEVVTFSGTFGEAPEPDTLRAEDLGISVQSISDKESVGFNLFTEEGVLVTDVVKGSPAAFSGKMGSQLLNRGDVIVSLGGEPTPSMEDFNRVLDNIRRDNPDILLVSYMQGRSTGYASLNLSLGKNGKGEDQ